MEDKKITAAGETETADEVKNTNDSISHAKSKINSKDKPEVDKAFFNTLIRLVGKGQRQGKTILQMSVEAGISYVTFYKYVTGKMSPGVENLVKIADYFGVSTDYLLGRSKQCKK